MTVSPKNGKHGKFRGVVYSDMGERFSRDRVVFRRLGAKYDNATRDIRKLKERKAEHEAL